MPKTWNDLILEARRTVPEVSPPELARLLKSGGVTVIDVRDDDEWKSGHIPGAIHISRGTLEFKIERLVPDRGRPLVLG